MQEPDDIALLREYVVHDSEEAFTSLVSRHVNKVYSVAWRHTRAPQRAEEITQAVFILLARKSRRLVGQRVVLSGWLYQAARLTAAAFVRSEIRRVHREQEAYMLTIQNESESETWRQIAPLLDTAMARLNEKDRHAVVLRFFDGKTLKEVGAAMDLKEDAAEKRVNRALEKLHTFFVRHGVVSTSSIIERAIFAHSVQAAPAGLAQTVSAVAVSKGAVAGGSILTLVKGAWKLMVWSKAKTAIAIAAGVILTTGTITPVIIRYHQHPAYPSILSSTQELSEDEIVNYARLTGMTPEEAARAFLEACAQENWTVADKFLPLQSSSAALMIRKRYGGLKIVSLGKPFKSQVVLRAGVTYLGVFLAYEVQLKTGPIKKGQMSIRCDTAEHHWYLDSGM